MNVNVNVDAGLAGGGARRGLATGSARARRRALGSASADARLEDVAKRLANTESLSQFTALHGQLGDQLYAKDVSLPVRVLRQVLQHDAGRAGGEGGTPLRRPRKPKNKGTRRRLAARAGRGAGGVSVAQAPMFQRILDDVLRRLQGAESDAAVAVGGVSAGALASLSAQLALAGLRGADHDVVPALVAAASPLVPRFSPQQLATTAWALARMRATAPGAVDGGSDLMAALVDAAEHRLRDMPPQALSQLAWAVRTHTQAARPHGHTVFPPAPRIMSRIASASVAQAAHFNPIALSQLLSSFAALHVPDPGGVYGALAAAAGATAHAASPRTLCSLLHHFATLYQQQPHVRAAHAAATRLRPGLDDYVQAPVAALRQDQMASLVAAVQDRLAHTMASFSPRDVTLLMCALAKSGCGSPDLYDALTTQCEGLLHCMSALEMSQAMWAVAVDRHTVPQDTLARFSSAVAAAAADAVDKAAVSAVSASSSSSPPPLPGAPNPSVVAVLAWSFARVHVAIPQPFVEALAAAAEGVAPRLSTQECCMVATAVARWSGGGGGGGGTAPHADPFDAGVAAAADARDGDEVLSAAVVASVMDAVAKRLLVCVRDGAAPGAQRLSPQCVSTLLWSVARVGGLPSAVVRSACSHVMAHADVLLPDFDPQQLSLTAWALTKAAPTFGDAGTVPLLTATLQHAAARDTTSCLPQSLSLLAWVCVANNDPRLAALRRDLMPRLAIESSRQLEDFAPGQLAMLSIAFGKYLSMQHAATPPQDGAVVPPRVLFPADLMRRVAAVAAPALPSFADMDVARVAWGFALAALPDATAGVVSAAAAAAAAREGGQLQPRDAQQLLNRAVEVAGCC